MLETQDQPLVSIIIPTKDRSALLLETLASVEAQTYQRWETVVVDDLSNDETWTVLQALAARDPRIRPLRRAGPDSGAANARNQGFAASRGSFIVFLDSDDLLTPTAVEVRLQMAVAHPAADAVVFQGEYFRNAPGEYSEECALAIHLFESVDPLDAFLTTHSPWVICGPLWRRAAVERVGPWDVESRFLDDTVFHTRALILGTRFERFKTVDQYIRVHEGLQVSRSNNSHNIPIRLGCLDSVLALLREHEMLTDRRKRMLAWSTLLQTLAYAVERPRPSISRTLPLWRAARSRGLIGVPAYLTGILVILSQWLNMAGALPREFARLILHYDIKRQSLFHPSLFRTVGHHLRWLLLHYGNWLEARTRARTNPRTRRGISALSGEDHCA